MKNPEYLTKDRLKSELKKHGVTFDVNENKDYYVQLYRKHVLKGKPAGPRQRSEFSSDEELVVRHSPRLPRKHMVQRSPIQRQKLSKIDAYLGQVQRLSDKELIEELKRYKQSVGPITDTTRKVYQRQLAKQMAEKSQVHAREEVDHQGEWSSGEGESTTEEEETEETEETATITTTKVSPGKKVVYQTYSTPKQTFVESTYLRETGIPQEPPPAYVRQRVPRERPPPQEKPTPKPAVVSRGPPKQKHVAPPARKVPGINWSFLFSFLLLVLVFVASFLAYDYYRHGEDSRFYWIVAAISGYISSFSEHLSKKDV